jgi:hypothetical protein
VVKSLFATTTLLIVLCLNKEKAKKKELAKQSLLRMQIESEANKVGI